MKNISLILCVLTLFSCSKNDVVPEEITNPLLNPKWCITEGPLPTGAESPYPLMNNPIFKNVNEITTLLDRHRVAIVSFNNVIKVYPYLFNNKFEIVNDVIGDRYYAVSYCPLTKTAINYNRVIKDEPIDLIASGYLYKDNMVPSDTQFNYFWSQMLMKGINNGAKAQNIGTYNIIQTTWKTVVDYFPTAKVFYLEGVGTPVTEAMNQNSTETKSKSTGNEDPDDVYAIIEHYGSQTREEIVHSYSFDRFDDGVSMRHVSIGGDDTILIGSSEHYFFTTYNVPPGVAFLEIDKNIFPPVLSDINGNKWNAFGYAFEGPRKGEQLTSPKSYVAAWWAWKSFYKNILIK